MKDYSLLIVRPILLLFSLFVFFTGCSSGNSPVPSSQEPISQTERCKLYKSDGRNVAKYVTQEYCRNIELGRLGVSTAYSNGYTGKGVTVAVLDSGIDSSNYDLVNQVDKNNSKSFVGTIYDSSLNTAVVDLNGRSVDQVENIYLRNGGSGYLSAPTVTINGDGTGATAIAKLDGNGGIEGIYLTNAGSGYSNATVQIDSNGTGGSGVEIDYVALGGEDYIGHGTSIGGIIAAEKNQDDLNATYDGFSIHGVAPDAKLINVKVLMDDGYGSTSSIDTGVEYASTKASILNISLGGTSSFGFDIAKYRSAVQTNKASLVIAAGNEGLDCLPDPVNGTLSGRCSFPAALPWISGNEDLLNGDGAWVVVGSVDVNNNISDFSNRAGVTKNNYIVAPGESVLSSSINDTQTYNTGTSFAAPFVAGAMALMKEKFPSLTGKQIAQIFFDTAQDLGAQGVDDVYGHGLIDIYAAFAPIGTLGVTTAGTSTTVDNSKKIPTTNTSLATSGVAGASLVKSQALQSTIAFDDYGRGYQVDMTEAVYASPSSRLDFKNFMMFSLGDVILGADQINNTVMVGYQVTKNTRVMATADDTLLGTQGDGLLGFSKANTLYTALETTKAIDEDIEFDLNLYYGVAKAKTNRDSLITNIDTIHALGGEARLHYKNFGVGYKIPLTAVKGDMELTIPTSRNIDGTVNYTTYSETMRNSDYEQIASLFYEYNTDNIFANISFEAIKNLDGFKTDKLDKRVSFNMNCLF